MHRKWQWRRRTLLVLGVAAVLFAAILVVGEHQLKIPLVRILRARTGRDIRVDGAFEAHLLSIHPTITANQVSIGNPPWMPSGTTANIGRLSLIFEWQPSIRPLSVRRLDIENATLHLARDSTGRANWHMHETGPGAGPPLIKSLCMPNARVELNDDRRHLQFIGTVSAGDAIAGEGPPPLRIEGNGQLNGRAASFAIDGDPLSQVRRDHPYHFTLDERSGASRLTGRGLIAQPFDFRVLQGMFNAAGPDMKDLYFLVGLGFPHTGPYRVSGTLARQGRRFVYSDLMATSGTSDMSGTLSVDSSSGRTRIEGELSSKSLRLADLRARAAGLAPQPPDLSPLRVSETAFRVSGMTRADASIQYRAAVLTLGTAQLRSLAALVSIESGVLSVKGFKTSFADGTIFGSARFDASRSVPRGELNLSVADLRLDQFEGRSGNPPFAGLLSGRVQLSADGNSFHELAEHATGTVTALVPHGSMPTSIADLASLDLIGALGTLLKSHEHTSVRCAVASFDAHDGLMTARTFVLDNEKVLITGTGEIHMDSESLDLTLRGQPTNARLALSSAVSIRGTLKHPEIRLLGRDVLAAALNVVLAPVAAVLAFVNPELPHSADCVALIDQAKASGPGAPAPHSIARGK